ncbi:MAG: hypothetical protein CME06_03580 [Gemmatimonadetes bacterium]|nr:hypothetical protein [Gemmatimonadota bacterium]
MAVDLLSWVPSIMGDRIDGGPERGGARSARLLDPAAPAIEGEETHDAESSPFFDRLLGASTWAESPEAPDRGRGEAEAIELPAVADPSLEERPATRIDALLGPLVRAGGGLASNATRKVGASSPHEEAVPVRSKTAHRPQQVQWTSVRIEPAPARQTRAPAQPSAVPADPEIGKTSPPSPIEVSDRVAALARRRFESNRPAPLEQRRVPPLSISRTAGPPSVESSSSNDSRTALGDEGIRAPVRLGAIARLLAAARHGYPISPGDRAPVSAPAPGVRERMTPHSGTQSPGHLRPIGEPRSGSASSRPIPTPAGSIPASEPAPPPSPTAAPESQREAPRPVPPPATESRPPESPTDPNNRQTPSMPLKGATPAAQAIERDPAPAASNPHRADSTPPDSSPGASPAESQQSSVTVERPIPAPSHAAPTQPLSAPGVEAPQEPGAPATPNASSSPKAPVELRLDELLETLNRRSDLRIARKGQELRLHIDPDDLGRLRIEIRSDEQRGVHAFIRVETEAARIALESRLGSLKAALTRNGITFGGLEVSVGGGQDHRPERPARPRRRTPETSSLPEVEPGGSPPRRAALIAGQLDLVV